MRAKVWQAEEMRAKVWENARKMAHNERTFEENVEHGVLGRGSDSKSMRKSRKTAQKIAGKMVGRGNESKSMEKCKENGVQREKLLRKCRTWRGRQRK